MGEYCQSPIHSLQGSVTIIGVLSFYFIILLDDNHWFINNVMDNHRGYVKLKIPGVLLQQRGWQYFDSRYGWQDDDTLSVKVTGRNITSPEGCRVYNF